ncbi:MAG: efflux RND transporter periplasmic adaptor subunit [Candidatus Baltobacteraceae bacterium]
MNRSQSTAVVVGGVLLVVLAGAALRPGADAVAVRELTVRRGPFVTKLPESGVIELPRTVTIAAGVGGNMGLIAVKEGERVRAGQLLATIVNPQVEVNLRDAESAAASAQGRADSIAEQVAVLPEQNRSAVVQAQAALVQARAQLGQARKDLAAGAQSGLGYGAASAEEQKLTADATLSKAATDLREARRTYEANQDLYAQKALSKDALDQSQARYEEALVTWQQAQRERQLLTGQLGRDYQVLKDRVRSAEDQVRQSEAALAAARAGATQTRAGDLQAARADADRAQADLAFAQEQEDHLQVRAPFAGIVESVATQPNDTLRPIQPGETVAAGQTLFEMAGNDRFVVRTKVDEQDVASVRVGQPAIVGGEDFGGRTLRGHVVEIAPIAQRSDDPSNTARQVLTTIVLEETLPFLRDGMTVDVDIVTHDEENVLAVPADALRKSGDGTAYVFVVQNGRAQRADVTLGAQNDTSAVVTAGLRDGDTIVAEKNPAVTANAAVKPAPSPGPASSGAP